MRYNTPVYIRRNSPGTYNPNTGNYELSEPEEEKMYADVQEEETVMHTQDLGAVAEKVITVTFQQPPSRPFTSIRYGETVFRMEASLYPRNCTTFVLKEER